MPNDRSSATPRHPDLAESGDALIQDAWDRESLYDLSVIAKEALRLLRAARLSETATPEFVVCHDNGEIVNIQHQGVIYVPESASRVAHSMSEYRRVKAMGGNVQLPASRCVGGDWQKANHAEESLARAIHSTPGNEWSFWFSVNNVMYVHRHTLPPLALPLPPERDGK